MQVRRRRWKLTRSDLLVVPIVLLLGWLLEALHSGYTAFSLSVSLSADVLVHGTIRAEATDFAAPGAVPDLALRCQDGGGASSSPIHVLSVQGEQIRYEAAGPSCRTCSRRRQREWSEPYERARDRPFRVWLELPEGWACDPAEVLLTDPTEPANFAVRRAR